MTDRFNLQRFVEAQADGVFERVLGEIQAGRKRTHWMWFIFPQLRGLGVSDTARFYGISSIDEARAYLGHELLGPRLRACAEAALAVASDRAQDVFSTPDDLKLRSSATLFALAEGTESVFDRLLLKFWDGEPDPSTVVLAS